jgi:hypothetical protein
MADQFPLCEVLMTLPAEEAERFASFLDAYDLAPNSRRAFMLNIMKFAVWFSTANKEPASPPGTRAKQSPWSIVVSPPCAATWDGLLNKAFSLPIPLKPSRSYVGNSHRRRNRKRRPEHRVRVKEPCRQQLAPKGLERPQVRRLLREVRHATTARRPQRT